MENNTLASADVDGKVEKHRGVEDNCDDLQRNPATAHSDLQSKSSECKHDGPEDTPGNGNPESPKLGVDCEDKVFVPTKISKHLIESSSTNGLEPREDKDCAEEWKIDKCLPPIKVRREGQSCDSSPSDLSPPSPKRMKPGSQEREDQWLSIWNTDAKE